MTTPAPAEPGSRFRLHSGGIVNLLVKLLFLGIAVSVAIALTPTLIGTGQWAFLIVIWVIAAILVITYSTGHFVPAKYLVPGVLMLTLFVVYPIVLTAKTSTTNYGDGTRNTKEETISRIIGASVTRADNAQQFSLSVGTNGSKTDGPFTYFLVSQADNKIYKGVPDEGLEELSASDVELTGNKITAVDGYEILNIKEVAAIGETLSQVSIPTDNGYIVRSGTSQAFEGAASLTYDEATDTITDIKTGTEYKPTRREGADREFFTDANGKRVSDQSWTANVGLDNYKKVVTNQQITKDFLRIFIWTVIFALVSVLGTFALGLLLATTLNDPRLRGQKIYRAILILPYAIPGFISLLIWASFFNRDFGLINDLTGLNVPWFSNATTAKLAVIITNLWMGFPYMFLVCTGALQSVPDDLKEAATIDGASGWQNFTKVTLPLVLVTVAPLLVATFAFNFNNFNAIQLLTEGGPFSPDNPTAGGTDILISYTIRLAFGAGGQQIGFASAISVLLFIITGVIAALQFRYTKALEDVN